MCDNEPSDSSTDVLQVILENVNKLVVEMLNERTSVRKALISIIFRGLSIRVVHGLLKGSFSRGYIAECLKFVNYSKSPLFTTKIPHKPHTVIIEDEKQATLEAMAGVWEPKSGQRSNTLFTTTLRSTLYTKYVELYPEIRRAVQTRGKEIKVKPRCMKTVFYRIFEEFNIYKTRKPHSCPHCHEAKYNTIRDKVCLS